MLSEEEIQRITAETMRKMGRRRFPQDGTYRDAFQPVPGGPLVALGVQAQGSLGVFDHVHRDHLELVNYRRSEWATLRAKVREISQRSLINRSTGGTVTVGLNDTGNAARTLNVSSNGAMSSFSESLTAVGDQIVMRWGSNNTAPTSADVALTAEVDNVAASSASYDTTLFITTFSGSKVYAGANTTAREIGFSHNWLDSGGTLRAFLFDHATISDTAVNTGQTVAVSYSVQF